MKKLSVKQGLLIFYLFDITLFIILVVSFLPLFNKNEIESMQTALLNPNRVEEVFSITLSKPTEDFLTRNTISLQRYDSVWIGTSSFSSNKFFWPCDVQTIESLIAEAKKITNVYTKSNSITSWKNLCVDETQSTVLTFYDENKNIISELFFGSKNELAGRIYFRTYTKSTVYEIESSIENFLSVQESFWADPFLFPQCVTGFSKVESQSLLRRGNIVNISPREGLPVDMTIKKDFGNGSTIIFYMYKKDDDYIVIPSFTAPLIYSAKEKKAIESLNYRYSISAWTYKQFIEE